MRKFVAIEGRVLAPILKRMMFVVERRNTYPILGMVRLAVKGATLTVSATDLDMELSHQLDVIDAGGNWSICVSPFVLFDIARLAGPAPLVMERRHDSRLAVIVDEDAAYDLEGLSPDSFPDFGAERGDVIERFTNGRLAELLQRVAWAVSREETRYYLNGVAWMWRDGRRRFVATDGHRLAVCHYDAAPDGQNETFIIPTKAVVLLSMLGGDTMSAHRMVKGNEVAPLRMEVAAGASTLRLKLVDGLPNAPGGYPDIDRVIPKPASWVATFGLTKGQLTGAIDRAMVMQSKRGAVLKFEPAAGAVSIAAQHPDLGSARASLRLQWPEALKPFGVNGRYLREIVEHCIGELKLHQGDPSGPLTILDEDATMTRVVMPMKV